MRRCYDVLTSVRLHVLRTLQLLAEKVFGPPSYPPLSDEKTELCSCLAKRSEGLHFRYSTI
jgi:hypothetical protein